MFLKFLRHFKKISYVALRIYLISCKNAPFSNMENSFYKPYLESTYEVPKKNKLKNYAAKTNVFKKNDDSLKDEVGKLKHLFENC